MEEQTVCLQCGDRGFTNAFVYCVRCLNFALHRYCLPVIPETLDEFVRWFCDDCESEVQSQHPVQKHDVSPYSTRDCKMSKKFEGLSGIMEKNDLDGHEQSSDACAKVDLAECGDQLANQMQLEGKNDGHAEDERKRSLQSPSFEGLEEEKVKADVMSKRKNKLRKRKEREEKRNVIESGNKKDQHKLGKREREDQIPKKKRKSVWTHKKRRRERKRDVTEKSDTKKDQRIEISSDQSHKKDMKTDIDIEIQIHRLQKILSIIQNTCSKSQLLDSKLESMNAAMRDQQSDAANDSSVHVRPAHGAAWRGKFNIPSLNLDIDIAAHVSKSACSNVLEVASALPESLCMEMIPRLGAWPTSFESSPPTEHSVALFFFPDGRDEVVDNLLNHTICADFALKSMIGEAELLIFTSVQLPSNLHRFDGKPYFWGLFRGQHAAASHQSEYHVHVRAKQSLSPNSGKHRSSEREGSPMNNSSENSSLTQSSKADRRGRGLDNAWEHAKPLDLLRQKAECRYCGFVSSHGGISRLKVHLGGGIRGIRLPGCDKVPPQLRKVMAEWSGEWLKKTKALWGKEVRAEDVRPETRGRRLDDAWKHAMPLDEVRQKTRCNYCGFISEYGGISRLKAHLRGGCSQLQLQGCPQVPLEVKSVMEQWFNEWSKNSTASWIRKSHASPRSSKRKRPLEDSWEYAILLDETGQETKCKYCGFVSIGGGIARLKTHLAGGDPITQLEGCPNVSPEIKNLMARGGEKKNRKRSKDVTVEPLGGVLQGNGRTLLDPQETLDEISNTSLKGRLQKMIEEKNAKLQKMQFEVQSLGVQLASIP